MDLRWRPFGYVLGFSSLALLATAPRPGWGWLCTMMWREEMASSHLVNTMLAVQAATGHRLWSWRRCLRVVSYGTSSPVGGALHHGGVTAWTSGPMAALLDYLMDGR